MGTFLETVENNDQIFKIEKNEEKFLGIITHRLLIFIFCKIIENTKNLISSEDFTCRCKDYTSNKKMKITEDYLSVISEWIKGEPIDVNQSLEIIKKISEIRINEDYYLSCGKFEYMVCNRNMFEIYII